MHTSSAVSKSSDAPTSRSRRRGILAAALVVIATALAVVTTVPAYATSLAVPPNPDCKATYLITAAWSGGFQSQVTVANLSPTAIIGWKVTWTFQDGQIIRHYSGANIEQLGPYVTATNLSWNGNLPPNAATSFGFLATHNNAGNRITNLTCATL